MSTEPGSRGRVSFDMADLRDHRVTLDAGQRAPFQGALASLAGAGATVVFFLLVRRRESQTIGGR